MSTYYAKQTVTAVLVSLELNQARCIAKQLAVSSKNARAIVLRAGNQAAGLAVIANFYDELANKTITLALSINKVGLDISTHSVIEWRNSTILARLEEVCKLAKKAKFKESIATQHNKLIRTKKNYDLLFKKLINDLYNKLDEILQNMRAIDVIAVTSKLEAVQTGEFKNHLFEMAEGIQVMANRIKTHVSQSISLLDQTR